MSENTSRKITHRLYFHLGYFLPIIFLPALWPLALWGVPRELIDSDEETRLWHRRAIGLAVVDTVITVTLFALIISLVISPPTPPSEPTVQEEVEQPRSAIGVVLDSKSNVVGSRLAWIVPHSPAKNAGLREGDVIFGIDQRDISNPQELVEAIQEQPPGVRRLLNVRRADEVLTIEVTPVEPSSIPEHRPGLFEPSSGRSSCVRLSDKAKIRWQAGALVALSFVLLIVGLRSGVRPTLSWVAFSVLTPLVMLVGIGLYDLFCELLDGPTSGMVYVSLSIPIVILLGGTLILRWTVARNRAETFEISTPPILSTWKVVALGIGYAIGGMFRVSIIVALLGRFLSFEAQSQSSVFLHSSVSGPTMIIVFAIAFLISLVASELCFRGLLLPWLAAHLPVRWALLISTVYGSGFFWGDGPRVLFLVFLGYVAGWARLRSGRVWAPILIWVSIGLLSLLLS